MRDEYDFRGGVRGKYFERYRQGTNLILLEPDLAKIFRDADTVNRALRQFLSEHGEPPPSKKPVVRVPGGTAVTPHLVGIDIGFSERRRSNGIAVLRDGELVRAERLSVSERDQALRSLTNVDLVAIDAPLLPPGSADTLPRHCERVFSRGLFQKRCKPGMSHIPGTGQLLREHGRRAAEHLLAAQAFNPSEHPLQRVRSGAAIVEAFPNAFLGVVVPDDDYIATTKIKRGGKFDWLYDRWIDRGLFPLVVAAAHLPDEIATRCETEKDHDIRAALVCLLTAAFAADGTAAVVGQEIDGYFFLPPRDLWAPWARSAMDDGANVADQSSVRRP